ncbi:hypothetical protein [Bradyrhizobium sp. SYSU BS000235]|uniref:hypothetical protein n=1 Tax=Bradyrhizobium sp. SYSU BS000235 TaxID=3411332 RepID=UPI003C7098D2
MGSKARALPKDDPSLRSTAGTEPSTTDSFDDIFTKPLSELLAYAPPTRGRSSTLQARAVADDREDRMPLFLERNDRAEDDDGFHFKQRDPAQEEEGRQDLHPTNPPAHWFEPEVLDVSTVSVARPGFLRYAAWSVAAAFAIAGGLGAVGFFGGAFSGSRSETTGVRHAAKAATAPKQTAISFDQIFAAVSAPPPPESKPETSVLSETSRTPQSSTVGIATSDVKVQTDKSTVQAAVPPAPTESPRQIDQAELASLLKRGKELIGVGDIASARLLLQRAADAREPQAALALAGTYDPAVLGRVKAYGIAPDPAMARNWYEKAREFGASEAQQRLEQLQR